MALNPVRANRVTNGPAASWWGTDIFTSHWRGPTRMWMVEAIQLVKVVRRYIQGQPKIVGGEEEKQQTTGLF